MAGGFPVGQQWGNPQNVAGVTSTTSGTVLTCGTSNTMGSWTTLIASTAADAAWMTVIIDNHSSTSDVIAVSIGVGAAASEQAIIPTLLVDYHGISSYGLCTFPVNVPAGTRLSAQAQSPTASDTCRVQLMTYSEAFASVGGNSLVDCYGFVSGSTIGTSVDCGGTINVKGSYTQISASTTANYQGFVIGFDCLAQVSQAANAAIMMDVALGAGGSEQIILPNFPAYKFSNGNIAMTPAFSPYLPIPIPTASRIAVRTQTNQAATPARLIGIRIYGVRQ